KKGDEKEESENNNGGGGGGGGKKKKNGNGGGGDSDGNGGGGDGDGNGGGGEGDGNGSGGDGDDNGGGRVEVNKLEYMGQPDLGFEYRSERRYFAAYPTHSPVYAVDSHALQLFSDENPNACSIM
ncbi:hypothetical protein SLA2020_408490, partial [Shorea laevis]